MIFCSQCKYSKYVDVREVGRRLKCEKLSGRLQDDEELLPTDWTFATFCPFYAPEKRHYRSRSAYRSEMYRCGIALNEEQAGRLADVHLK